MFLDDLFGEFHKRTVLQSLLQQKHVIKSASLGIEENTNFNAVINVSITKFAKN